MVYVFVAAQCLLCLIVYLSAVLLGFTHRINVCGSLPPLICYELTAIGIFHKDADLFL